MSTAGLVQVSVLGPIEVTVAGQPLALGGPGRRALIATLALDVGTVVGVPRLLEAIWGDDPPATATTKLQGHVCALRQGLVRLGGPRAARVVRTRRPGYVLCAPDATTDLDAFENLVRQARNSPLPSGAARRAAALEQALLLWRGDACTDLSSPWVAAVAASLDERRRRATEDLAEARLALGEHDAVIDAMQSLVQLTPYRERAWEHLISAHLERGDFASALAVHDQLCRILAGDLGTAPGVRISRLIGAIRRPRADSTSLAER
ncbi:AfsR/SARP family transcriptional regulator [Cryptosporangium arvum]|uniref:DNA-binding transcriptional activator of the SARP family n=1 Tax=Cryptosporangium arvum DSM 44712 TaxID=927661 RepID=A0A010ZZA7_9ACTN|nr:BTAD domain-containing putative transcriptional regulator [Cryptosporangium arvum]EXG82552.1 DNA-binding transcriptional activator of the SARP family [Cryptosporangium arvum DSM 44712]